MTRFQLGTPRLSPSLSTRTRTTRVYGMHRSRRKTQKCVQIGTTLGEEGHPIRGSCSWVKNRCQKEAEKIRKYGPLRYELKQQFKGYKVEQFNIIMGVLGGYSAHLEEDVKRLVGRKSNQVLRNRQKSVISSTLNITRTFKTFL